MAKRVAAESSSADGPISAQLRMLVLHGKERYIQDEHFQSLKRALIKVHSDAGVEVKVYDVLGGGPSAAAGGARMLADVFDDCRSFGLMSVHKLVVVENVDALFRNEDDDGEGDEPPPPATKGASRTGRGKGSGAVGISGPRKLLEAYAADPSDNATLVLRASGTWRGGNIDKGVLALGPRGAVIKCEQPSEQEAVQWAVQQAAARHKAKIDNQTAMMLVSAVGADLGRIDSELAKLAVAAGGKGQPITAELVEQMTGTTRQDDLWGIQSRLLSGSAPETLTFLRQLIDVSRADPVPLSWAYVDLSRKLHMASRGLSQGMSRGQLLGPMKAWGSMGDAIFSKVPRLKPDAAGRMFKACLENDLTGKTGLGDPVRNLEVLTVRMSKALEDKPGRG